MIEMFSPTIEGLSFAPQIEIEVCECEKEYCACAPCKLGEMCPIRLKKNKKT